MIRRWIDPEPEPCRRPRPCPACEVPHGGYHADTCPHHPEVLEARVAAALRPDLGLRTVAESVAVLLADPGPWWRRLRSDGITSEQLAHALEAALSKAASATLARGGLPVEDLSEAALRESAGGL